LAAYFVVVQKWTTGVALGGTIGVLAVIQMFVQLIFFLHLGKENKPRWNTLIFAFMLLVLLIVVLGTLWIMHSLDTRVMGSHIMDTQVKGLK